MVTSLTSAANSGEFARSGPNEGTDLGMVTVPRTVTVLGMVTVPRTVNGPSGPRSPADLRSIILKMTRNSRLCRRWSIDFLCMILKVIPKLSGRYTLSDNICFTFDPKAFLRGYNGRPLYLNWNIFASIVTFPKGSLSRHFTFEPGILDHQYTQPRVESIRLSRQGWV